MFIGLEICIRSFSYNFCPLLSCQLRPCLQDSIDFHLLRNIVSRLNTRIEASLLQIDQAQLLVDLFLVLERLTTSFRRQVIPIGIEQFFGHLRRLCGMPHLS